MPWNRRERVKGAFFKGESEGFAKGENEGFTKGENEGFAKGENEGFIKGREEGRIEGRIEGRAESFEDGKIVKSIEIAKNMLFKGIPIEDICEITGLRKEMIE